MDTGNNKRYSILKPQKSRNPLSDLDLDEPVKDDSPVTTTRRSSLRRVSFACSNFVKEFTTDPEKNTTLWDTTYEERLNQTDPSSSSSEIARNPDDACSEKQFVTPESETAKNLKSLNQPCVTTYSEAAEKIGLAIVCSEKANRKTSINFYEEGGEDIISDSSLCDIDNYCENRIIETRNIQSSNDIKNVNVVNTAIHTMAVAQQIVQRERHTGITEVSVTGIYDTKDQVSTSNTENKPFTNLVDRLQNLSSADKENIPVQGAANIEFTPKLQSFHKSECGIKNGTIIMEENMEFTQQLPIVGEDSYNPRNKTSIMDSSIELYQSLLNVDNSNVNDGENIIGIIDENMEITQQLPVDRNSYNPGNKTIVMNESMEYTQELPALNFLAVSVNGINESPIKDDGNRTVTADENMEITQQLPVDKSSYNPRNETLVMAEDLECTQQVPSFNFQIPNVKSSSKTVKSDNVNKKYDNIFEIKTTGSTRHLHNTNMESNTVSNMPAVISKDDIKMIAKESVSEAVSGKNVELPQSFAEGVCTENKVLKNSAATEEIFNHENIAGPNKATEANASFHISRCAENENKENTMDNVCNTLMNVDNMIVTKSPVVIDQNTEDVNNLSANVDKIPISQLKCENDNIACSSYMDMNKVMTECHVGTSKNKVVSDCSGLKTPGSSFHISFTPCSPGIDDTQHLINYYLTDKQPKSDFSKIITGDLNPSFLSSKFMPLSEFSSDAFPVPEQLDLDVTNVDENMETSMIENRNTNISQEDLTLSDSIASDNNSLATEAKQIILNITQSINANGSINKNTYQLQKNLQESHTSRALFKQRFGNFMEKIKSCAATIEKNAIVLAELYHEELEEITTPFKRRSFEDIKGNTDSSLECSLVEPTSDNVVVEERLHFHTDSDLNINIEKVLTIKEKIEEKEKRCKTYWNVLSIENDKCEFDTLYKTIRIIVNLDMETGIVNKTDICCKISDESEPTALFVHKVFKDRLSPNNIQSAVGKQYDILTLLDYVYMNMQKMLDVMKEFDNFDKQYNMKMDGNFRVTFNMVNFHLCNAWCISVDMSDLENINEDSITAYAKVGTVNETEIKRFAVGCSRGTLFLRSFIKNIRGYVELLMQRQTLMKPHATD